MPRWPASDGDTPSSVLDVAERLVQTRGFNGFSYADVAAELHLSKAALHYHFPGKAELGEALLVRYTQRFAAALETIDSEPLDAPGKLAAYANLYLDVLRQDRMCLCGMIAAEYQTLPEAMQAIVVQFFLDNETWLRRALEQGLTEGTIGISGGTQDTARSIVANLEGAMLVARPFHDIDRFQTVASATITALRPTV
ncbi:MAG: TetR/AcrR family transcriptional regulator [Acidimicrobiales bacterium]|jgi:TetR/AcrR family transcriptional repressor of nem operon